MPLSLKNAGVTFQRMMIRMFKDKIGSTVEVYIDDMVMKSWESQRHVDDLIKVFEILQRHKLRLNANKCAFGVEAGKFLGYMITYQRIEVNPDQISAIERLKPPRNPKDVHSGYARLESLQGCRSIDMMHPIKVKINGGTIIKIIGVK